VTDRALSVVDHGADPTGASDSRAAFQDAINAAAGREVWIPNGRYLIGHRSGDHGNLMLATPTTLRGESREGVTLAMTSSPLGTALVYVAAPRCSIRDLTIDGQWEQQPLTGRGDVDPHRAGIFVTNAPDCTIERVTAQGLSGDGFYAYNGSDRCVIRSSAARGNRRNGITWGGGTDGTAVIDCEITGNLAQQLDSEPTPGGRKITGGIVSGNLIDPAGASDDYALTITGALTTERSAQWVVSDNDIRGAVIVTYADDIMITRNKIVSGGPKPPLTVYRACSRIDVINNAITNTGLQRTDDGGAIVWIVGTEVDQMPRSIRVAGNKLTSVMPSGWAGQQLTAGVCAICADDVTIASNLIIGAGVVRPGNVGVFVRATRPEAPVSAVVERNDITGFGEFGLLCGGNTNAKIRRVDVNWNSFDSMPAAIALDDGFYHPVEEAYAAGNKIGNGVTLIQRAPSGCSSSPWGDGWHWKIPT
jgi:hypothetical protein